MNEGETPKITVHTAMMTTDKTWKNGKRTAIRNGFKSSNFILDDVDEDTLNDEEICTDINISDRWSLIAAHNKDIPTFDEFVHFNDDVAVARGAYRL